MNNQLSNIENTKYFGYYRGQVIDNNDPDKAGKCRIMIMPMFSGVTLTDLPWAIPKFPIFDGSGNGTGYFAIPKNGTFVWCFFEEGHPYQPVYDGEAPSLTIGIPNAALVDYPNSKVLQTSGGFTISIDDQAPSLTIIHPMGTAIQIDKSGNLLIQGVGTLNAQMAGAVTINSSSTMTVNSTAATTISAAASVSVTAVGNASVTAGGTVNVTSTGAITLHGSVINLNAP